MFFFLIIDFYFLKARGFSADKGASQRTWSEKAECTEADGDWVKNKKQSPCRKED